MNNTKGMIGIVVLIILALIVGSVLTYWYVKRGIPNTPGPVDITYKDVPKDGEDVPYQPIVPPEPAENDYKVYEDTIMTFQYPRDWVVLEEHTGVVIQGRLSSSTATSTIILNSAGVSFPESFKSCLTPTPITIQGRDATIDFLCDLSPGVNAVNRDIIRAVVDTGHSFVLYGLLSKKDTGEKRAEYMKVFTEIATSLEFKNN